MCIIIFMNRQKRALLRAGLFPILGLVLLIAVPAAAGRSAVLDSSRAQNGSFRTIRQTGDGGWALLAVRPELPDRMEATPLRVEHDFQSLALFPDPSGLP